MVPCKDDMVKRSSLKILKKKMGEKSEESTGVIFKVHQTCTVLMIDLDVDYSSPSASFLIFKIVFQGAVRDALTKSRHDDTV